MKTPKNFEQGMSQLEQLLDKLADPDTTLDQSITLYAQAAQLVQFCEEALAQAKLQIEQIDQTLLSASPAQTEEV